MRQTAFGVIDNRNNLEVYEKVQELIRVCQVTENNFNSHYSWYRNQIIAEIESIKNREGGLPFDYIGSHSSFNSIDSCKESMYLLNTDPLKFIRTKLSDVVGTKMYLSDLIPAELDMFIDNSIVLLTYEPGYAEDYFELNLKDCVNQQQDSISLDYDECEESLNMLIQV